MIAFAKPPGTAGSQTADELLAEFRQTGAPAPFEELVRRYAAMVFSECYSVTKSRHDAEDAAQATFLTLAVQARSGDEIRHLGPWLQRVARRVALDQEKAKRRRRKREDNHHRVNGSSGLATSEHLTLDQLELRHVISEELQELPARYRMPLVLHYFGGMTREQMAKELKCKPATLGVRLFRARDMLGKRLAKRGVMLPAVAIPLAIAMVVRDSVANHGILSMAATASQIARAASHVACGLPMASHAVSPMTMSLVNRATSDLVLRKVKAIIAAAAIGASALAAGSAEVVRKIHDGSLSIPGLFDTNGYFRFLKSPGLPQLRVDATQVIQGPQLALGGSALDNLGLVGPGRLELSAVTVGGGSAAAPSSAVAVDPAGSGGISGPARAAANVKPDQGAAAARAPEVEAAGAAVASGRPAVDPKGDAEAAASSTASGADATDPSQGLPLLAASVIGGGGGGGGGGMTGFGGVFVLNALPPLTARNAGQYGTSSSSIMSSGSGSSAAASNISTTGGVLRGWGKVAFTGTFQMNGVVIADGYGQQRTLDLSSVADVTHSVLNSPGGINGWYAQHGAKLVLPASGISAGTSSFTWGDAAGKTTLDLVNTARLTVHDAASAGLMSVALLAPDRSEVPAVPGGYDALTIWGVSSTVRYESIDITARYGLAGSDLAGATSGLHVFYYNGGKWNYAPDSDIDISRRLITANDIPASAFIALFTTHGKATEGLAVLGVTDVDATADATINPVATTSPSDVAQAIPTGVTYAPISLSSIMDSAEARMAYASTLCFGTASLAGGELPAGIVSAHGGSGLTIGSDGSTIADATDVDTTGVGPTSSGLPTFSRPAPLSVPEPGGLLWVGLALPLLARRRR